MIYFRNAYQGGLKPHTIVLDMNDGSDRKLSQSFLGDKYELPDMPPYGVLPGYQFDGWSYTPTGEKIQTSTITLSDPYIYLYVKYV